MIFFMADAIAFFTNEIVFSFSLALSHFFRIMLCLFFVFAEM